MLLGMGVDWTQVLVLGVPAYLTAIISPIVVVIVAKNRAALKTPSGDRLGAVVERTHDITHATDVIVRKMNGNADAK